MTTCAPRATPARSGLVTKERQELLEKVVTADAVAVWTL